MVLGADRILDMVRSGVDVEDHVTGHTVRKPLVENLTLDQIEKIEGTTVDLRIGAAYRPVGPARLMRDVRVTPEVVKVVDIADDQDAVLRVTPGEYLLFQTIEQINLPSNLFAYIRPRTTLIRSGIPLSTAFISPNYQGRLTVGARHAGSREVDIQVGFRILCIAFFPIDGTAVPYRGVWQGDRVSTNGKEERPF